MKGAIQWVRNLRGDEEFDEPLKKSIAENRLCEFAKKVSQLIKAEWNQIVFFICVISSIGVFWIIGNIESSGIQAKEKKSFYLLSSVLILLIQKEESSESNPRKK